MICAYIKLFCLSLYRVEKSFIVEYRVDKVENESSWKIYELEMFVETKFL